MDPERLAHQSRVDQGEAGMIDLGRVAASFFNSMREQNMPAPLASVLVRDWFYMQTHRALYGPDVSPSAPFWSMEGPGEE